MKVDITKQFQGRSYRVKGIDMHPTEPWVLCSLFTGAVQVWNYETKQQLRSLDVSPMPVRACRFIARKNWFVTAGDDMQIRVFNYNTLEKVAQFEGHHDYIRTLAVHPTQPFLLSAGDDMVINLWNWDQNWNKQLTFTGHTSYVMYVAINQKDPNTFASACMDRTVKVWSLNSPTPNFTLTAHETKGVNFVEYYPFGDKPYLITTSDDQTIRIFDYQSKAQVATLAGHSHNVSFAVFHPELPIIISGSEDSTIKVWNARSYKLEASHNYGLERAWCINTRPNSSSVAIGFETGNLLLRFGSDAPAVSMDHAGKLVWSKHLEAFSATIKQQAADAAEEGGAAADADDQRVVSLTPKDLGAIEVHPSQLLHSPNGRFVAVVGDGEYIIYTALAWRNKTYGQAVHFAWAQDSTEYAVRLDDGSVRAYKNFAERSDAHFSQIDFPATRIFGGSLLGVAGDGFIAFYDWDSGKLVHSVDVDATDVVWADSGELLAINTDSSFFVLRYNRDVFQEALANETLNGEDGADGAFDVVHESSERIRNGKWVGDCYIFSTASNRLNYLVGTETYNISHFDKDMYLLGYIPRDNAIYLCDKDVNVVSFKLSLAVVEYQTVVLRGDLEYASELLANIPEDERNRVARFLEAQGLAELALDVSKDPDHRFDLALELSRLDVAQQIATTLKEDAAKWKSLGDLYLRSWRLPDAETCFTQAGDIDTLLLIYTSTGNKEKLAKLAEQAVEQGRYNLAFNAFWFIGDVDRAAELLTRTGRSAEATLLSLTWGGDVAGNVKQWKKSLAAAGRGTIADSIIGPEDEPAKFPANLGQKTFVRAQVADADLIDVDVEDVEDAEEAEEAPAAAPTATQAAKPAAASNGRAAPEAAPPVPTEPAPTRSSGTYEAEPTGVEPRAEDEEAEDAVEELEEDVRAEAALDALEEEADEEPAAGEDLVDL